MIDATAYWNEALEQAVKIRFATLFDSVLDGPLAPADLHKFKLEVIKLGETESAIRNVLETLDDTATSKE